MKFARYLEEQSVPEWKRAYLNYRGMKKLIKRVQQRREKRLNLELERKSSKASNSSSINWNQSVGNIRRRGTALSSSFRRNTGDGDLDVETEINRNQDGPNYRTFVGSNDRGDDGIARVQFNTQGIEAREDDLPKVSLNGTGLKLLSDDQFGDQGDESNHHQSSSISKAISNVSSNIFSTSRSSGGADEENRTNHNPSISISNPNPNANLTTTSTSGTWNSQTPTTNPFREESENEEPSSKDPKFERTSPNRTTSWMKKLSNTNNHDDLDSDETNVGSSSNHKTLGKDLGAGSDLSDRNQTASSPTSPEVNASRRPTTNENRNQSEGKMSFKIKGGGGGGSGGGKKKGAKAHSSLQQLIDENFDDEEAKFFSASDAELERILEFYEQREKEMKDRFTVLARQLKELAEHRREYKAKHAGDESTTSNIFSGLRTTVSQHQPHSGSGTPSRNPDIRSSIDKTRQSVDQSAEDEGDKRRSIALAKVLETNKANLTFEELKEENERARIIAHDPERYKNARKKLKAALVEYYRTLELLKNFKILNRTGFQKCMKKLEKTVQVNGISESYYKEKVSITPLVKGDKIEKLIKATEDIFTAYFEHGNRKHALERLRAGSMGPVGEMTTHHFSVFRTGIYLGIALCATVAGIVQTQHPNTYLEIPNHERLFRVYGALFLPALFALLFGLNLAAWHRARINTIFIFEWDVRHAIDYRTYFEMPAFFLLLLSIAFWVSFLNPFPASIAPTTWPMVWIVVVLLILLNPIPITIPQSRSWFVKSIIRVFQAGLLHGVEFRDFFLGDELNSLAWSISNLWLIGCEYNRSWKFPDQCDPNGTFWTAALTSVPAFLRLIQCFRRFRDSGNTAYLHLVNAGKYSSAILYYWFYHNYRYHGSHRAQDLALWIVFASIYSVYTSSWDILMDWSLLRRHSKYPFLRNELAFESVWPVYYFSIISNIILRFSWTVYLMPGPASLTLKIYLIALLEVLRRFQWNFYRLENEQLGNNDQYRVSKDVPLPYKLPDNSKDLDDEDYDSGNNQTKSEIKNPFERFKLKRRSIKAERHLDELQGHDFAQDLASSDNDSNQLHRESNENEAVDGAAPTSKLKAKIRERLAPDADTDKRIDHSGAARGIIGKDYVRKNDVESDSD